METNVEATVSTERKVTLFFRDSGTGVPVTGLTAAVYSPVYGRKDSGATFTLALSPSDFVELDSSNLPGFYEVTLPDTILNTVGETVFFFPSQLPSTEEVVLRVKVNPALVSADLSTVTTSLEEIKGAGFATGDHSLVTIKTDQDTNLDTIYTNVLRVLGLSQENMIINGHVYDGDGNLTQSSITIYPSRNDLILDQNAIATYTMLATYDVDGRITEYSVRKNP